MEDFHLNQKVRETRSKQPGFTGAAEKIREIAKPILLEKKPEPKPEPVVKQNPVETLRKNLEEKVEEKAPEKETVSLLKGFSVGVTDGGVIKFVPFGSPNRLELVGFSEYVKVKMNDILNQMGNTYTVDKLGVLSDGITAVAQGVNALLQKDKA